MNRYLVILILSLSSLCACSTTSDVSVSANPSRIRSSSTQVETPSPIKTECPHLDAELQKILKRESGVQTATLLAGAMSFQMTGKPPANPPIPPVYLYREHLEVAYKYGQAGCCQQALHEAIMIKGELSTVREGSLPQEDKEDFDLCTTLIDKIMVDCWRQ